MMSGIPVNRIAQTEMNKLSKLPELIKGKVIGQDEAVNKVAKAIQRNLSLALRTLTSPLDHLYSWVKQV